MGAVDAPDQKRKIHTAPIPRLGGVPIMAAYALSFLIFSFMPLTGRSMLSEGLPLAWKLVPATLIVFATGILDDLIGLKPWQKFAGQLIAAGLVCLAGVRVNGVAGFEFHPVLAVVATLFWLTACTNAFNLIDGIDGLAAGISLFATLTTLVAALVHGHVALALATVPLAGALLGFLRFNFNPASIFLGDSGSLTLGFLLGCYGIIWSQKSATLLGMTAPLIALAIPLLDTAVAIGRRVLRRQPVFSADRAHIHHKLLERGLTPRRVALTLYGLCGLAALLSIAQTVAANQFGGVIVLLFCVAAWFGIQHLGYVEFGVAGRLMVPGKFLKVVNAQLRLRALEDALVRAETADACWLALCDACRDFGFSRVTLRINGASWESTPRDAQGAEWTIHIPLSDTEYVAVGHEFEGQVAPMLVSPLADVLRKTLGPRMNALRQGLEEPAAPRN